MQSTPAIFSRLSTKTTGAEKIGLSALAIGMLLGPLFEREGMARGPIELISFEQFQALRQDMAAGGLRAISVRELAQVRAGVSKHSLDLLGQLQRELQQSVQKRINVTKRLGSDPAHGERQSAEQSLIRSIAKMLSGS
jgi:hypothetical protein